MTMHHTEWWNRASKVTADAEFWHQFRQLRGAASLAEYSSQPEKARDAVPFNHEPERLYDTAVQLFIAAAFELNCGASFEEPHIQHTLRTTGRLFYFLSNSEPLLAAEGDLLLEAACAFDLAGFAANAAVALRLRGRHRFDGDVTDTPTPQLVLRLFLARRIPELRRLARKWQQSVEPGLGIRSATHDMAQCVQAFSRFTVTGDSSLLDSAFGFARESAQGYTRYGIGDDWLLAQSLALDIKHFEGSNAWAQLGAHVGELGSLWKAYIRGLALGTGDIYESDLVGENVRSGCAVDLWQSQILALRKGFLSPDLADCIVRMPTSAGKTRLAEFRIVSVLSTRPDARCIYVVPYLALANEIRDTLRASLGRIGVRVGDLFQGEYALDDIDQDLLQRNDVVVCTPEKLDLMLRQNPDFLCKVGLFIFDEGHMIDATARGVRYEFLIDRLIRLRKRMSASYSMVVISAVIPNATHLAIWIAGKPGNLVDTDWRPTDVRTGVFHWRSADRANPNFLRGDIHYPNDSRRGEDYYVPHVIERRLKRTQCYPRTKAEISAELARSLVKAGPVVVFASTKRCVEAVVRAILRSLDRDKTSLSISDDPTHVRQLRQAISVCRDYLGDEHELIRALQMGFGYHTGAVPQVVRGQIEKLFQSGAIKVVVCTNTLAQGVNLPIKSLIVHSLNRGKDSWISSRDFKNMEGRAARALRQIEGQVVFVHDDSRRKLTAAERHVTDLKRVDGQVISSIMLLYAQLAQQRAELAVDERSRWLLKEIARSRSVGDENMLQETLAAFDAQLLGLLVEEASADLQVDAEAVLGESLFSIQAAKFGLQTQPVYEDISGRLFNITKSIQDPDVRRRYFKTGLGSASCRSLEESSSEFLEALTIAPNTIDEADEFLVIALHAALQAQETRPIENLFGLDLDEPFLSWIRGVPVNKMPQGTCASCEMLSLAVEDVFVRKFPWGFNSLLILLEQEIQNRQIILPPYARYLSALSRYGVPSIEAATLRAVGVTERTAAIRLSSVCPYGSDFEPTLSWLSGLQQPELMEIFNSDQDTVSRVLDDIRSAQLGNPGVAQLQYSVWNDVEVRGIKFHTRWQDVQSLELGEQVALEREADNSYDSNAIQVLSLPSRKMLGYVHRDLARTIAPLMDEDIPIGAVVSKIDPPSSVYPSGMLFLTIREQE